MSAEPVTETGWTLVCQVDDIACGTVAQAEVDGRVIALARDAEGVFHALDDRCTHGAVSLSEGEVEGCMLECWLHGSRFDLRTGQPSGPPAIIPVAVFPVKVEGDDVFVDVVSTR
ncbi:MAG: non-heme iron oxygenase ferredoxin subunit [Actinomycetota bacterium]|nr:non-heme iron oxygenase ferredoxin subunit [Actinomycetota bacterium]